MMLLCVFFLIPCLQSKSPSPGQQRVEMNVIKTRFQKGQKQQQQQKDIDIFHPSERSK